MSFCVVVKMKADPARMQELFENRADELREVAEKAKQAGALHHFFALGEKEGEEDVVIVDEWQDPAAFLEFFEDATIASFMEEFGVEGPPEVSVFEIMDSPDRF